MQARPGPAYKPEHWQRGYSREQIVAHLDDALDIYDELADRHEIAPEIRPLVFQIVTQMSAAVEPTDEAIKTAQARAAVLGNGNGGAPNALGLIGQG